MEHSTVFVIMWYDSSAEAKVIEWNNGNKTDIVQKLMGVDHVSWSYIDMGIKDHTSGDHHDTDYSVLYQIINGKKFADESEYLKKQGPIVNVIRASKGVKITGKGIPDETADQVDTYQRQVKKENGSSPSGPSKNGQSSAAEPKASDNDNMDKQFDATQGSVYGF